MIATVLFCGSVQNVRAQHDELRHEIGISYGSTPLSTWGTIGTALADGLFQGLGGARYENRSSFGSLSAEYFYHPSPSVGIGGIVCYSQDIDDIFVSGAADGERTTRFFTVMPAVKWDYLHRKHFGMYMKAAAGYTLERVNETYKEQDETKNSGLFSFQLSLLGIEAGSPHVRGFVELGVGEQGIALAGLRCKF